MMLVRILGCIFCLISFGVSLPVMAQSKQIVLPAIFASVSKVERLHGGKYIGSASGFFYEAKAGNRFFVTNRHVVYGDKPEPGKPLPVPADLLRLRLHTDATNPSKSIDVTLPLFKDGNPIFLEDKDPQIDVVLIPVEAKAISGAIVNFITAAYCIPDEFPIAAGEDAIIVGYPLGFFDVVNNLPLFRTASIATVYGVNFQGLERCVLDGNIQPGMSGSPVFMKPTPARINKDGAPKFLKSAIDAYVFLGVLSQRIPVPVNTPAGVLRANIGLVDCWYPQILERLATKHKLP